MPAYDYTTKRTSWNKGLTKDTDSRVAANYTHLRQNQYYTCPNCHTISRWRNRKQIYCSTNCYWISGTKSASMQGSRNPIFGGHRPETRLKMQQNHADFTGEKNGRWLGGISFEPYGIDFNQNLKGAIRQRDNFTCQLCSIRQNGRLFNVHHIDYSKVNNKPDNLITLCDKCHSKVNSNRNYWQDYFRRFLLEKKYASLGL